MILKSGIERARRASECGILYKWRYHWIKEGHNDKYNITIRYLEILDIQLYTQYKNYLNNFIYFIIAEY